MKWIVLLLLLCGCSKSVVIDMPKTRAADTTYIPREIDTTHTSDVPIGFDVSVEGWEDIEIDINL